MAGFDKLKTATSELTVSAVTEKPKPKKKYEKAKFGPKHQQHYAWLMDHGYADLDEKKDA